MLLLPVAALLLLPCGLARADQNQIDANATWKQANLCAKDAFKKFPDYTAESNAKRDAARRECLRDHKLPDTGAALTPVPPSADAK
jgi:hypothetical protein